MSDTLLVDYDPILRSKTYIHETNGGKDWVIESKQNADDIIEQNKREYNSFDERTPFGKETYHKVASLPMNLGMQLMIQGMTRDWPTFRKWLNNADNRFFRTRPGRL